MVLKAIKPIEVQVPFRINLQRNRFLRSDVLGLNKVIVILPILYFLFGLFRGRDPVINDSSITPTLQAGLGVIGYNRCGWFIDFIGLVPEGEVVLTFKLLFLGFVILDLDLILQRLLRAGLNDLLLDAVLE